ncbi:hypothetical protein OE88DRAFT_1069411 [Heliocybe sulcata]|uniref:Uncharacterized protein n=1 Tax=Heliocybe sulcata TaxID=5364 RepID=A0A5C3MNH1_9AGAM|nr:hypothetical protein OE88DRAFT_1069411 [Heliocybe sulcata]
MYYWDRQCRYPPQGQAMGVPRRAHGLQYLPSLAIRYPYWCNPGLADGSSQSRAAGVRLGHAKLPATLVLDPAPGWLCGVLAQICGFLALLWEQRMRHRLAPAHLSPAFFHPSPSPSACPLPTLCMSAHSMPGYYSIGRSTGARRVIS